MKTPVFAAKATWLLLSYSMPTAGAAAAEAN